MKPKRKRRILCPTEASFTFSGFGTYAHQLLTRLHESGKFEIAELANYAVVGDHRAANIPWKFYPNAVLQNDPRWGQYQGNSANNFGAWRFERAALDLRSDVVFGFLDPWMFLYQARSPFRPFYNWCICPTVDSEPQKPEWLYDFASADGVMTYTDWGKEVLDRSTCGRIKTVSSTNPGTDSDTYKPVLNKIEHKRKMGLTGNEIFFGTTMRNQRRKLYPDFFKSFNIYLDLCKKHGRNDLVKNSYLYCHTSFPDCGWAITSLLTEMGLTSKVYFTYYCQHCKYSFPSLFKDAKTICPRCNTLSAVLPSVANGVSTSQLAEVYNLFDLYMQPAICLGQNEQIKTLDGWKNICDITTEDFVFTHNSNWKQVTKTFINTPTEENGCFNITLQADYDKIDCITGNHPVYALTKEVIGTKNQNSLRETIGDRIRANSFKSTPAFIDANKLKRGDLIAYPIDMTINDIEFIDMAKYSTTFDDTNIYMKGGKTYPRFIDIDLDFCKLMGLYVADGSANGGTIKVTQHIDEGNRDFIYSVFRKIAPNNKESVHYYKGRKGLDYMLNSTPHNRLFRELFKKKVNKQLPDWVEYLPLDKQKAILDGWLLGDGHILSKKKNRNNNTNVPTTISRKLADQIKNILQRLRINYNVRLKIREGNRQPEYRFEVSTLEHPKRMNTRSLYMGNFVFKQIKHIDRVTLPENVYNIEVQDDNSYLTKVGIVHNCEGLGYPLIEAASCGVPVAGTDITAMVDVVRKLNGTPLELDRIFRTDTEDAWRGYPSLNHMAETMYLFAKMEPNERIQRGVAARQGVLKHYTWDNTAKIWIDYLENCELTGLQGKWDSPPNIFEPSRDNPPSNVSNDDFIQWCILNIVGDPSLLDSYFAINMAYYLNYEVVSGPGQHPTPYSRQNALDTFRSMAENRKNCELARCGLVPLPREDWVEWANNRK